MLCNAVWRWAWKYLIPLIYRSHFCTVLFACNLETSFLGWYSYAATCSFFCFGWLCGDCFVTLSSFGGIDFCLSFVAEIASFACSNKLACLKDVNLLTESDMDIVDLLTHFINFNLNSSLYDRCDSGVENIFVDNHKNNYELFQWPAFFLFASLRRVGGAVSRPAESTCFPKAWCASEAKMQWRMVAWTHFFIAFMQYSYLLFWCLDLTNYRI